MRKPHGRLGPFVMVAACAAAVSGCKEDFSDEPFGALDLASVYDGGTSTDPAAGLPELLSPLKGYAEGVRAEYYDFGAVIVKRNPFTGEPTGALAQPMYFFFNLAGQPLFSAPVRETRDGTDWIRGGKGVLNPNPKDFCAGVPAERQATDPCKAKNDLEKKKPYATRLRDPLVDRQRRVADYQRPIIDVTPLDRNVERAHYTGLWEIVEVTVADGYAPDAIKHKATIDKAVAGGQAKIRPTGKVINCPLVDERTVVARGVADRVTPRPRIEVWYRRQIANCYLVHGWETLGTDKGELLFANSDVDRVETFDVLKLSVGEGKVRETRLLVPVAKGYNPIISTTDASQVTPPTTTRVIDNFITRGVPKRFPADPPGYTPIRWMWTFDVESTYTPGNLTSVESVDPAITATGGAVRNYPLRGLATVCGHPMQPTKGNRCGRLVQDPAMPDNPMATLLDAKADEVCNGLGLECNPNTCFCDAPFVKYGQVCGPGIAQCDPSEDSFSKHGYTCLFPFGGYCYMRCKPGDRNERESENKGKKPAEVVDTRCKGIPGYRCLGYLDAGICLKLCDTNVSTGNQCEAKTMVETEVKDINQGQICQDFGIEVCSWPDGFEPVQ